MAAATPRTLGCLVILAVLAWLSVELWVWIEVSLWLNRSFRSSIGSGGWLLTGGWIVLMLYVGIKLAKYHGSRIMSGLLTGTAGRHLVGVIGAVLLALPGMLTDVIGLFLLLPPVQKGLGRFGTAVASSLAKRAMGGGFGPMMGKGFPGGSPFPGMQPLKPDDLAQFRRGPTLGGGNSSGPKTYDTTVEKD